MLDEAGRPLEVSQELPESGSEEELVHPGQQPLLLLSPSLEVLGRQAALILILVLILLLTTGYHCYFYTGGGGITKYFVSKEHCLSGALSQRNIVLRNINPKEYCP